MNTFEIKKDTHIVIKTEDLQYYLTELEFRNLDSILKKINEGRKSRGKKINKYLIINTDEPYANKVMKVIREGELEK
jgi:hypothetical protein